MAGLFPWRSVVLVGALVDQVCSPASQSKPDNRDPSGVPDRPRPSPVPARPSSPDASLYPVWNREQISVTNHKISQRRAPKFRNDKLPWLFV